MYPHIDPISGIARISSANMILKRWHNKSVSKALPALAPFVPRMLKEDIALGAPQYGPRRKVRSANELAPEPDTSAKSECLPVCAHIEQADADQRLTRFGIPSSTVKPGSPDMSAKRLMVAALHKAWAHAALPVLLDCADAALLCYLDKQTVCSIRGLVSPNCCASNVHPETLLCCQTPWLPAWHLLHFS